MRNPETCIYYQTFEQDGRATTSCVGGPLTGRIIPVASLPVGVRRDLHKQRHAFYRDVRRYTEVSA